MHRSCRHGAATYTELTLDMVLARSTTRMLLGLMSTSHCTRALHTLTLGCLSAEDYAANKCVLDDSVAQQLITHPIASLTSLSARSSSLSFALLLPLVRTHPVLLRLSLGSCVSLPLPCSLLCADTVWCLSSSYHASLDELRTCVHVLRVENRGGNEPADERYGGYQVYRSATGVLASAVARGSTYIDGSVLYDEIGMCTWSTPAQHAACMAQQYSCMLRSATSTF